jgi:hypothetical protein
MTLERNRQVFIPPQFVSLSRDDLRRHATASGQEVWEQLGTADAYACRDVPGVVLTRGAVRARPHTFLMHASVDGLFGPARRA